jgi:Holliday junction resolvase RusA-like endonuclease
VWGDDAQIVSMALSKSYGTEPGVTITINPLVQA